MKRGGKPSTTKQTMKTTFIAIAAAATGLLIAGNTFAPQKANAQAQGNFMCRGYEGGQTNNIQFPCNVQFDAQGATVITFDDFNIVRGVNGATTGFRNAECLRRAEFAVCPVGQFNF